MKPLHPLCKLFPPASEEDYAAIVESLKNFGFNEDTPIVTYQDQILDGQNRARACEQLGIPPRYTAFIGNDPLGFVIRQNLSRRHLTAGQRAMLAVGFANLIEGDNAHQLPAQKGKRKAVHVDFHVSRDSLAIAKRLCKVSGELAECVKRGDTTLHAAETLTSLPPKKLQAVIEEGPKAMRREARRLSRPAVLSVAVPHVGVAEVAPAAPEPPAPAPEALEAAVETRVAPSPGPEGDRLPEFAAEFRDWWQGLTDPYGAAEAPGKGAKLVRDKVEALLSGRGV